MGTPALVVNRYLIGEISWPLAAILGILVALFASFSAANILSDAVNGLLPTDVIAELIGLKVLISLEVLIPISLFLSVVLSFGKLYGGSEIPAMFALGVTPARVMGAVLSVSGTLAVGVAILSLFVRPWAYQTMHGIAGRAAATLNTHAMEAGVFYVAGHGDRVIFIARRAGPDAPAHQVFALVRHRDRMMVVSARSVTPPAHSGAADDPDVALKNAHVYEIGRNGKARDQILSASRILMNPNSATGETAAYSAVAIPTVRLATSRKPADVAELEWRLSTALSTLLLGMLGVPLSRSGPRQSRYARFGTAILIYSAYYLLCTTARTLVQHGTVPGIPGLWWAPGMLALVLVAALIGRRPRLIAGLRRARA